jgi:uncharacterized membrane protein YbhN (UPF0104 family)
LELSDDSVQSLAVEYERTQRGGKKIWIQVGTVIVAVAIIVGAVLRDKETLAQALAIPWTSVIAILVLLLLYFTLYAYRFVLLIDKHCGCRIGLLTWIRMLVVVRFLNAAVPQMGTVYRAITLKRDFGVSYRDYISANLFFIWTDTIINFAIALAMIAVSGTSVALWGYSGLSLMAIALVTTTAMPFLAQLLFSISPTRPRFVDKLTLVVKDFVEGARDPVYMLVSFAIAFLSFMLMAAVFKILLAVVEVDVSFATLALFNALYRLTFHVSITPGNIGIRELAYGLLCAEANIGMSKGVLVSSELRVFLALSLVILAILAASREIREAWMIAKGVVRRGGRSDSMRPPIQSVLERKP